MQGTQAKIKQDPSQNKQDLAWMQGKPRQNKQDPSQSKQILG